MQKSVHRSKPDGSQDQQQGEYKFLSLAQKLSLVDNHSQKKLCFSNGKYKLIVYTNHMWAMTHALQ